MIPPASISPPCRPLASPDPAPEDAGLSLDLTQEQDFGDLLDQHELGQSDPLPCDLSGPNSDPARQAAAGGWSWPMIRWDLAPPADTTAPELAQGEEDIIPFGSDTPKLASALLLEGRPSCRPWMAPDRTAPAPPNASRHAGFFTSPTLPLDVGRPSGPVAPAPAGQTAPPPNGAPAVFSALPSLDAMRLPETPPDATGAPATSPRAAEPAIPLRPAMPEAQPPAPAGQTEPPPGRAPAGFPATPSPVATGTGASQESAPASGRISEKRGIEDVRPGGTGVPPVWAPVFDARPSLQTGETPVPPVFAIGDAPPASQLPKNERGEGTSRQAENAAPAPQGPKSPAPFEASVIGSGAAKGSPATSGRSADTVVPPTAAPNSVGPPRSSLVNLSPIGSQESKVAGSATGQPSASSGEQESAPDDTFKTGPASQRGAETPPISAVPPAAALAGSAARSPETPAPGRSDLAPLIQKVWEAAESLSSAHRGRMDLDVPLQDNETVRIRVELRSGAIHATIRTDSPELRDALEKSWPEFAGKSGERGFKLADANFSPLRQDAGGSPGGQGRDHRPEQNSWQHRHGGQPSQGGGHAQPRTTDAAPPNRAPATAGPMTLWA